MSEPPLSDEELDRFVNIALAPFSGVPADVRDGLWRLVSEIRRLREENERLRAALKSDGGGGRS